MSPRGRRSIVAAAPLALLLACTALPLLRLLGGAVAQGVQIEVAAWRPTLMFAGGGAAIGALFGGSLGAVFGTRKIPGAAWLVPLAIIPIAAPPAFWWLGVTRLAGGAVHGSGVALAALVAGVALAPVSLLLVFTALRQTPANVYEAARVALPPWTRVRVVLLPLLRGPLRGAFAVTLILLLGESELPFLFGFRTVMTDIVTTFAQTYDVRRTMPLVVPLLLGIVALSVAAGRPIMHSVFASSRGSLGIRQQAAGVLLSVSIAVSGILPCLALAGYASAARGRALGGAFASFDAPSAWTSVAEPVACAWAAIGLTVLAAYPARRSALAPTFVWTSLVLFCVPASVYAIGWIDLGQRLAGATIPPALAHVSRGVAVAMLAFFIGYARVPASTEGAATLALSSASRRARVVVLPLLAGSLSAAAALIAALTYADRDVASLLLPPGASRLMLDLYLLSANAPAATIGFTALAVWVGAILSVIIAAAGPAMLRRRGA